ncbi:MAG: DUF1631 family protein [Azospira sp.]|jgi:hypothetical protein|nr:DUF1631 family protein [Azospira sp.]
MATSAHSRVISPGKTGAQADAEAPLATIGLASLSAHFLASLEDRIERRPATQAITGRWPDRTNPRSRHVRRLAIDIVDMLFSFVTSDTRLPHGAARPLLAAQLPVLHLALREPAFFADWQHPARQLLDDLAPLAATCAVRTGKVDAFTEAFTYGLSALLEGATPDGAAFAHLHRRLHAFATTGVDATDGSDGADEAAGAPTPPAGRADPAARTFPARPRQTPGARDEIHGEVADGAIHAHHSRPMPRPLHALGVA